MKKELIDYIIDEIIEDLVENRDVFKEINNEINYIIKHNSEGNNDLSYDEFCIKCLDKLKNKSDLSYMITKLKQTFFESMIEIIVDELTKKGNILEADNVKKISKEI
jgi:hypothetical protein